jgi:hypothetical protein
MPVEILRAVVTGTCRALRDDGGLEILHVDVQQLEDQYFPLDAVAVAHNHEGPVRRIVFGCNRSLAEHVAQLKLEPAPAFAESGERDSAQQAFTFLTRALESALSVLKSAREHKLGLRPRFHIQNPDRFRARADGARNFAIEVATPAGNAHVILSLATDRALNQTVRLPAESSESARENSDPDPFPKIIESPGAIQMLLRQLAQDRRDVHLKLKEAKGAFSLHHATLLGLSDKTVQPSLLLSSSYFGQNDQQLDKDTRIGVVFTERNQVLEFTSPVSGISQIFIGETARLPVLHLNFPQRIVPGQRRRSVRIAPSSPIKGWVRPHEASRGEARPNTQRHTPIQVKDLSVTGARLTLKNGVMVSKFKWGCRVLCRLELPEPFGPVQVKGVVQRLSFAKDRHSAPTVHVGIDFIEDERSLNVSLRKIHDFLIAQQRQECVPV